MTMKGTSVYQAPELTRGERYGFAADVFSFALTMYEVCDRVSAGGIYYMESGTQLCDGISPRKPSLFTSHRIFHTRDQREITGSNSRLM